MWPAAFALRGGRRSCSPTARCVAGLLPVLAREAHTAPDATSQPGLSVIFEVSADIAYAPQFPSAMILSLHAQETASQKILREEFTIDPHVDHSVVRDPNTERGK